VIYETREEERKRKRKEKKREEIEPFRCAAGEQNITEQNRTKQDPENSE